MQTPPQPKEQMRPLAIVSGHCAALGVKYISTSRLRSTTLQQSESQRRPAFLMGKIPSSNNETQYTNTKTTVVTSIYGNHNRARRVCKLPGDCHQPDCLSWETVQSRPWCPWNRPSRGCEACPGTPRDSVWSLHHRLSTADLPLCPVPVSPRMASCPFRFGHQSHTHTHI